MDENVVDVPGHEQAAVHFHVQAAEFGVNSESSRTLGPGMGTTKLCYQPVENGGQAPHDRCFRGSSRFSVRSQSPFSTGCYTP
jgi:hypothetical protein